MRKVTITIETENAAFADDPYCEIGRILFALGGRALSHDELPEFTIDANGNRVGTVTQED